MIKYIIGLKIFSEDDLIAWATDYDMNLIYYVESNIKKKSKKACQISVYKKNYDLFWYFVCNGYPVEDIDEILSMFLNYDENDL